MRFWSTLIALMLLAGGTAFPQETWTNYGQENEITDIAVRGDYIWCATLNGLVRWDKRDMSYRKYTIRDGLPHSVINSIEIAPGGALWCGTVGGVARFDGSSWRIFRQEDGLPYTSVKALAVGPDGSVWAATRKFEWMFDWIGAVSRFDGSAWTTLPPKEPPYDPDEVTNAISIAPDSTAWLLTDWKLFHHDGRTRTEMPFTPLAVTAGPDGAVWAGTKEGVKRYDGQVWTDVALPAPHAVSALTALTDGTVWAGAAGGLLRYDGAVWAWHAAPEELGLGSYGGLVADSSGTVWIGTPKGLVRYDGAGFRLFRTGAELIDRNVLSLGFEPNGTVWVGTSGGVSRYDGRNWRSFTTADGLPGSVISSIMITPKRDVWIGTSKGAARYNGSGWKVYTIADGLAGNTVNSIGAGPDNAIWFATDNGLSRFDGETWKTYTAADGMFGNWIESVAVTESGIVWAGGRPYGNSYGGAVSRFDGVSWTTYPNPSYHEEVLVELCTIPGSDGVYAGVNFIDHALNQPAMLYLEGNSVNSYINEHLFSGIMSSFTVARDGTVWAGSVQITYTYDIGPVGAVRIKDSVKTIFTECDGIAGWQINTVAIAPDGAVWFGTDRGLSRYGAPLPVGVESEAALPKEFAVVNNSPNPFNPSTTISFTLPLFARAELAVYSITGQKVRTLLSGLMTAGTHSAVWDGKDEAGKRVSSGIYIAQIRAGEQVSSHKMLMIK